MKRLSRCCLRREYHSHIGVLMRRAADSTVHYIFMPESDNMAADGMVYHKVNKLYIELYVNEKSHAC